MCVKCVIAAILSGQINPEMMGTPEGVEDIKAKLKKLMGVQTREEWLSEQITKTEQSIEAQRMALAVMVATPTDGRLLEGINAVGTLSGDIVMIITYSSEEGDFWVDRKSKLNPHQDVSYETTSREAADQIAEDLFEALN